LCQQFQCLKLLPCVLRCAHHTRSCRTQCPCIHSAPYFLTARARARQPRLHGFLCCIHRLLSVCLVWPMYIFPLGGRIPYTVAVTGKLDRRSTRFAFRSLCSRNVPYPIDGDTDRCLDPMLTVDFTTCKMSSREPGACEPATNSVSYIQKLTFNMPRSQIKGVCVPTTSSSVMQTRQSVCY
jgi:hypothetical protein